MKDLETALKKLYDLDVAINITDSYKEDDEFIVYGDVYVISSYKKDSWIASFLIELDSKNIIFDFDGEFEHNSDKKTLKEIKKSLQEVCNCILKNGYISEINSALEKMRIAFELKRLSEKMANCNIYQTEIDNLSKMFKNYHKNVVSHDEKEIIYKQHAKEKVLKKPFFCA